MPERLDRDYRFARRASRVGAAALYGIAALSLMIGLGFFLLCAPPDSGCAGYRLIGLAVAGVFTISVVLLAEFLRHFGQDSSPFGERQFLRLVSAALLMGVRAVFDALAPVSRIASPSGTIPVVTHIDLDLKIISVVIFLVCLAMVVRYGDALKEDSDSFV